jgi:hypothetical protein
MTNEIDFIASASPAALDHCGRVAGLALAWGERFIILAFFAALAFIVADFIVKVRKPPSTKGSGVPDKSWLDALKGVLDALANLPGWVTIFLAGFLLLWIARDPASCIAPKPSDQAAQKDAQSNTAANQTAPATNQQAPAQNRS